MKTKIIILLLLIFLSMPKAGFAGENINKNLYLRTGYSYLLRFNGKITDFSLGNTDTINIKLLSKTSENKDEIILKPVKNCDTNLLIWTGGGLYNFLISVNEKNSPFPLIQNFTELDELDIPPYLPEKSDYTDDIELDKPPVLLDNASRQGK